MVEINTDGIKENSSNEDSSDEDATKAEVVDENESNSLQKMDEETVSEIVSSAADTYLKIQRENKEHNRSVLRMEMIYNASILAVLSLLILTMVFLANLDPMLGLTFIAGLATGFGTNTALTSLS
ncbi:hypothetical protein [Natronobacterium texcoconense]|uniref:hypothetical protein n=1 Tax=Natronobacterium texcoconense TaxID=1095778 RepID=UPI00111331D0|nr:hypothetical protein [Natronobacterium texcoconense]